MSMSAGTGEANRRSRSLPLAEPEFVPCKPTRETFVIINEKGRAMKIDLINMPTEDFPLNLQTYSRLMGEIREAARGFEQLHDHGWPAGNQISSSLMDVYDALWISWNLIQETERELLRRHAAATPKP